MASSFLARSFYFVLFEPADERDPKTVIVSIWEVDPRSRGFAYSQVDYLFNIGLNAPFNLWPGMWKFALMQGVLIYRSTIAEDDTITTQLFPGEVGEAVTCGLDALPGYSGATGITREALIRAVAAIGGEAHGELTKRQLLEVLEAARGELAEGQLEDLLAEAIYGPRLEPYRDHLPADCMEPFNARA